MAYPISPSNNQVATVNGIAYIYSSTTRSWTRLQQATAVSINPSVYLGRVTATTAPTLVDTIPVAGNSLVRWTTTSFDSVNNQYRVATLDSLNNGTTVNYTEYGVIVSNVGTTVATFTSNITSGNINLYVVGNSASVAVTFERVVLGSSTTVGYLNGVQATVPSITTNTGNVYISGNLFAYSNVAAGTTTRIEYNIPHPFLLMGAA